MSDFCRDNIRAQIDGGNTRKNHSFPASGTDPSGNLSGARLENSPGSQSDRLKEGPLL